MIWIAPRVRALATRRPRSLLAQTYLRRLVTVPKMHANPDLRFFLMPRKRIAARPLLPHELGGEPRSAGAGADREQATGE
jgi:hypothetical protein